ncbi:Hypothetical protein UVM_LOCUS135, partial [uncultured virus]
VRRSDKRWARCNPHFERTANLVADAVSELVGVTRTLPWFALDSLATPEDGPDFYNAESVRETLLDRCFAISPRKHALVFPKPRPWLEEDAEEIRSWRARRSGILLGLQIWDKKSALAAAAQVVEDQRVMIEEVTELLRRARHELAELDGDYLVIVDELVTHASLAIAYFICAVHFWGDGRIKELLHTL